MKYILGATVGTVVAGGNGRGLSSTQLIYPVSIYLDTASNSLFISNFLGHNIVRWVLGANSWTWIVGRANGIASSTPTLFLNPVAITFDPMGNLYVADAGNHRIQLVMYNETIGKTIAGVSTTFGKFSLLLYFPY